ncbi:hypothetical protein [Clostridium kluyveri]|uniref:Uncharacterized protein n=2 Tax=Clostridium kluyveri TaxID=1534 RepID=A5N482_CLOK5|nr:hypothetical protein [Clostridium kluyveri]EDK32113.1 Hypothetical protein CKL_0033 [Clostridium kluyveri DSM 555]BAH05075.1 hypothetical protein CKR_0024 [Clostridium kluyveri NBRC 12016]
MVIYWKDKERKDKPDLEINGIENKLIVLKKLLKDSKIVGIRRAINDVINQYKNAIIEFTSMYNTLDEQMQHLRRENMKLQVENENLKRELDKGYIHKRQGEKFDSKLLAQKNNILYWKILGISDNEIARRLKKEEYGKINIGEGGIRHFLKTFSQP